jgi:CheY-like chemotaxis protein
MAVPYAERRRPLVLCIDDEKPVLSALARLLRREPYDVVTTDNPEEALDRVRAGGVSLIVADYRMPGISGTSLLQVVKASSPTTIRVMLTGYPEDGWIRAAEENGLMRVCTKPWDDREFKQLLREELALPGKATWDSDDGASPPGTG